MENRLVYCIIVTYNSMPWIDRCLQSVASSTYSIHCLIIDNASTDQTAEYISKTYPWVELMQSNRNLGFGQANNIGITAALHAGADFLFLINQDVYIHKDCVKNIIDAFQQSTGFGLISPIHLAGNGEQYDQYFSFYLEKYQVAPKDVAPDFTSLSDDTIFEIEFMNAAAWMLSAGCARSVGGFDPVFFHYGEDDNYAQRVRFNGYKIGICKTAIIRHDHDHSKKKLLSSDEAAIKEFRNLLIILCDPHRNNTQILMLKRFLRYGTLTLLSVVLFRRSETRFNWYMTTHIAQFFFAVQQSQNSSRLGKAMVHLPSPDHVVRLKKQNQSAEAGARKPNTQT